jgi:hypothetical protein
VTVESSGVRLKDKSLNFVTSGRVRPLKDRIIVKPLPLKLAASIDADWHGAPVRGVVLATGPGSYPNIHARGVKDGKPYRTVRESRQFRPIEVKIGDVVSLGGMEIGGYLFPQIWFQGAWCVICQEADVAVIEDA